MTREDFEQVCADLGPDELSVLVLIARRLQLGAKVYGALHIEDDPRDLAEGSEPRVPRRLRLPRVPDTAR